MLLEPGHKQRRSSVKRACYFIHHIQNGHTILFQFIHIIMMCGKPHLWPQRPFWTMTFKGFTVFPGIFAVAGVHGHTWQKPILPDLNGNKLGAGASDSSAGRRGDQLRQEGRSSQHHPPEMVSPLSSDLQPCPQRLQTRRWPARTHSQEKDHRAAPALQLSGRLPALQLPPAWGKERPHSPWLP